MIRGLEEGKTPISSPNPAILLVSTKNAGSDQVRFESPRFVDFRSLCADSEPISLKDDWRTFSSDLARVRVLVAYQKKSGLSPGSRDEIVRLGADQTFGRNVINGSSSV